MGSTVVGKAVGLRSSTARMDLGGSRVETGSALPLFQRLLLAKGVSTSFALCDSPPQMDLRQQHPGGEVVCSGWGKPWSLVMPLTPQPHP